MNLARTAACGLEGFFSIYAVKAIWHETGGSKYPNLENEREFGIEIYES